MQIWSGEWFVVPAMAALACALFWTQTRTTRRIRRSLRQGEERARALRRH